MKKPHVLSSSFFVVLLCALLTAGCSISSALHGGTARTIATLSHKIYLDLTTVTITEGSVVILNVAVDSIQSTDTIVNLSLSSTSVYSRFNPVPAQITIPAGQLSKSVVLNTIDDSISQPTETWILNITAADPLIVADPGQLTITLLDNDSGGTTPETTGLVQLKEFNPYPSSLSSINFKNKVFFATTDAAHGMELWVSDGTSVGTTLLKDIYPGNESSNPSNFFVDSTGTYLYFSATTAAEGQELWRTDGTLAGTISLGDIEPGAASSNPEILYTDGGLVYFTAITTLYGYELWVTDGSVAGTHLLIDIEPGATDTYMIGDFFKWNSQLYFGASLFYGGYGGRLYVTDGTSAGTTLVVDKAGATGLYYYPAPVNFSVINNKLVFSGGTGSTGWELVATDGTNAGTTVLKNFYTEYGSSSNSYAAVTDYSFAGENLISLDYDDDTNSGFWLTDATPAGTHKVLASASVGPILGSIGGKVIFSGYDGAQTELWTTDGTVAGTTLIKDINPGAGLSSYPTLVKQIGNKIIFRATTAAEGQELWVTDGTAAGTILLQDINVGVGTSSPGNFVMMGSYLYFTAYSPTYGIEIWKTDATQAGTQIFKDINPGVKSSGPVDLLNVNNTNLFFAAYNPTVNFGTVYVSDLTSAGTFGINHALVQSLNSETKNIVSFNGKAYFDAMDNSMGNPLWSSDGTAAGTVKLVDLNQNITCSDINYMFTTNSSLFFTATSEAAGNEMYVSDGSAAGTGILKDIYVGTSSSSPTGFTKVTNGNIFFTAYTAAAGTELWMTDGTSGNTNLVKDLNAGADSSAPSSITAIPGTNSVIFSIYINPNYYIYTSDGTAAGTVAVAGIPNITAVDLNFIPKTSSIVIAIKDKTNSKMRFYEYEPVGKTATLLDPTYTTDIVVVDPTAYLYNPRLNLFFYFTSNAAGTTVQLWKSDGTVAGTVAVTTIPNNGNNFGFQDLIDTGTKLTFQHWNNTFGGLAELWVTDGTAANTTLVQTFTSAYTSPYVFANQLFFKASDAVNGRELWKSDGTPAGTGLVKDINPGIATSNATNFTTFNGKMYFQADDGTHGAELWESDGTTGGTNLLYDINPGSDSSSPMKFTPVGTKLFFYANKVLSGKEVWVYIP